LVRLFFKEKKMCLAAPVKVIEILKNGTAVVEKEDVRFSVSSNLFPELSLGEYVLVHAGFIIQKIDTVEAEERIEMIKDLYRSES